MLVNELNVALKVSSTEPLLRSALSGIRFRPSPNNTASVTVANPEHFYSLNELEYQVTPITLSVRPRLILLVSFCSITLWPSRVVIRSVCLHVARGYNEKYSLLARCASRPTRLGCAFDTCDCARNT